MRWMSGFELASDVVGIFTRFTMDRLLKRCCCSWDLTADEISGEISPWTTRRSVCYHWCCVLPCTQRSWQRPQSHQCRHLGPPALSGGRRSGLTAFTRAVDREHPSAASVTGNGTSAACSERGVRWCHLSTATDFTHSGPGRWNPVRTASSCVPCPSGQSGHPAAPPVPRPTNYAPARSSTRAPRAAVVPWWRNRSVLGFPAAMSWIPGQTTSGGRDPGPAVVRCVSFLHNCSFSTIHQCFAWEFVSIVP